MKEQEEASLAGFFGSAESIFVPHTKTVVLNFFF